MGRNLSPKLGSSELHACFLHAASPLNVSFTGDAKRQTRYHLTRLQIVNPHFLQDFAEKWAGLVLICPGKES